MSRRIETQRKEVDKEVCVELHCDLCGEAPKCPADSPASFAESDWSSGRYDVSEITVSYRRGYVYPDDQSTTTESFDVCPKCWESKVVPFFAQHGAAPRVVEPY